MLQKVIKSLLVIILLCAILVGGFFGYRYFMSTDVIVLKQNISAGTVITSEMYTTEKKYLDKIDTSAIVTNASQLDGKEARIALSADQPIYLANVQTAGIFESSGVSTDEYVAVYLPLSKGSDMASTLKTGDAVYVSALFEDTATGTIGSDWIVTVPAVCKVSSFVKKTNADTGITEIVGVSLLVEQNYAADIAYAGQSAKAIVLIETEAVQSYELGSSSLKKIVASYFDAYGQNYNGGNSTVVDVNN